MADEINATDAAVKLAEEQGLDLADVLGTGLEGRVTKGDVEAHLAAQEPATVEAEPESEAPAGAPEVADPVEPDTDPVLAIIAALPNLGTVINWPGDRVSYAAELHARALELLG